MKGLLFVFLWGVVTAAPCFNLTDPDEAASMANARMDTFLTGPPMACGQRGVVCDDFFGNCTVISASVNDIYMNGLYLRRIYFPSMREANRIFIWGNFNVLHSLQSVEFLALEQVVEFSILAHQQLVRIDLPVLSRGTAITASGNSMLGYYNAPILSLVSTLSIMQSPLITYLDLISLRLVDSVLFVNAMNSVSSQVKICPTLISILENSQYRPCGFPNDRLCSICDTGQNNSVGCNVQCGTTFPTETPTSAPTPVATQSYGTICTPVRTLLFGILFFI